jgi:hypothetical protein
MKKTTRRKYPLGGEILLEEGGGEDRPTTQQIREKYKSNQYVQKGREAWGEKLGGTFPLSGGKDKVKDAISRAAQKAGVNPSLLYTSAMEEGMQQVLADPNAVSEAYGQWSTKNPKMAEKFPVDGFFGYGLDRFGENYQQLIDKGYLPKDFTNRFTSFDATNERNEKIKSAAFYSDEDALMAKAAVIRNSSENLKTYLGQNKINLSPKQQDFFTLAAYNYGDAGVKNMLKSYQEKGYLKDDKFLDPNFKPASYSGVYTNVQRRLQNKNVLENEGFFKMGGKIYAEYGDEIDGDEELKGATNSSGDIWNMSNTQNPVNPLAPKSPIFTVDNKGTVSTNPDPTVALSQYYDKGKDFLGNTTLNGTGKYTNDQGQLNPLADQQAANDITSAENLATSNKLYAGLDNVEKAASVGITAVNRFLGNQEQGKLQRTNLRKAIMDEQFAPVVNPYAEGTGSQAIMKNGGKMDAQAQGFNILDGGKADYLSSSVHSNPMVEFKGNEHKDGGIGIEHGGQMAEVEDKEVGWIDQEGSLNIFGKMKLPGTNQTFKKVAKDISKQEAKVDGQMSKYLNILNNSNPANKYQETAIATSKVMFKSLDKQAKEIAEKKEALGSYQNLILEMVDNKTGKMAYGGKIPKKIYAEGGELPGDDEDILKIAQAIAKIESSNDYKKRGPQISGGKYKGQKALGKYQVMPGNLKQWSKEALGKEITEAEFLASETLQDQVAVHQMKKIYGQYGKPEDVASVWFTGKPASKGGGEKDDLGTTGSEYVNRFLRNYHGGIAPTTTNAAKDPTRVDIPDEDFSKFTPKYVPLGGVDPVIDTKYGKAERNPTGFSDKVNLGTGDRTRGYISPLAIEQIAPELLSIATNKRESVPQLSYQPELKQTFDLSYQLGRNENQSTFNQVTKIAESTGNVDALSQLAAQKYKADEQYNMQEVQGNAQQKLGVYGQNVDTINDSRLKNLALISDQQNKMAQAKFNTRKEDLSAIASMSSKVLQNELENKTYNAYANLFKHYGFDKKGNVTFNPDDVVQKFSSGESQQFGMMAAQQGANAIMNGNFSRQFTKVKNENGSTTTTETLGTNKLIQEKYKALKNQGFDDGLIGNMLRAEFPETINQD